MRITRRQLRQIIQEELVRGLNEDAHESEPLSYADKLKLVEPSDLMDLGAAVFQQLGIRGPFIPYGERQEKKRVSFDKENPATVAAIVRAIAKGPGSIIDSLKEVIGRLHNKNVRLPDSDRIADIVEATLEVSSQSHKMTDKEALKLEIQEILNFWQKG